MANFHTDEEIMKRVQEHYDEALTLFPESRIVGIFLQGSQNYGLEIEGSDVDTKLIVVPTLEDIIFNRKPVSTTYVRENNEHIDLKDIRLMFQTFRKQNLNFVEILFTPYKIINPQYAKFWKVLEDHNEEIARYNPYGAVKTMKGIALEKFHAMEHEYPSKMDILAKHHYDPKQLHHLIRVHEYIIRYISGEKYADCLISNMPHHLKKIKDLNEPAFDLASARVIGKHILDSTVEIADKFCSSIEPTADPKVEEYLDNTQREIMKMAIAIELMEDEYYD